jgi:hypothetical protein
LRENLGINNDNLLATSEFSASINADTWQSCASGKARDENNNPITICNYKDYRNFFLNAQLVKAKAANIKMMFWTWLVPYNDNFQSEWALGTILDETSGTNSCKP